MALHPDVNDGDHQKTAVFKRASEAYAILSNHDQRTAYDNVHGVANKKRSVPKDYRKVYSPKAPPGFGKTFDGERHYKYHYGNGFMEDEVERARKRAEQASARKSGYQYESPLGKGFTFSSSHDGNPYSKRARQGPHSNDGVDDVEYEEAHYYDLGSTDMNNARRVVSRQEIVRQRMQDRRQGRVERNNAGIREEQATGCNIM